MTNKDFDQVKQTLFYRVNEQTQQKFKLIVETSDMLLHNITLFSHESHLARSVDAIHVLVHDAKYFTLK